jgi:hypothetical protein
MAPRPAFIDLGGGPFADEADPTLDADIKNLETLPLPPPHIHNTIASRETAWQARLSYLGQWHALHVRMTASDERAKHRVIVRELKADHKEEMEELRRNHQEELMTSDDKSADVIEFQIRLLRDQGAAIEAMRRDWGGDVIKLTEALNASRRLVDILTGLVTEPHLREQAANLGVMGAGHPADARATMENTGIEVAIHHPNNVKRAKDIRVQRRATDDHSWTALENLSQQAGGLPIRRQRLAQGLPTPQGMNETVRLIGGYWIDTNQDTIEEGMGKDYTTNEDNNAGLSGHYRRGNGNVTRSGRLITRQASTTKVDKWLGHAQTSTQIEMQGGPRSAKTVRDMEKEMTKEMTRERLAPVKFETGSRSTGTDVAAAVLTPASTSTSESKSGGVAITTWDGSGKEVEAGKPDEQMAQANVGAPPNSLTHHGWNGESYVNDYTHIMNNNSPTHHGFNVEAYGDGNGYDHVMNNGGPRTA